jgi:serine/threonine protein phosphatase 1
LKQRTLVIGDIHGGLVALKQVMERAEVTASDTLILLGDYVDGWSESFGVIEFIMQLVQQQNCVVLKGNHDDMCEEWLKTGEYNASSYNHGGKATLQSYAHADEAIRQKHLQFYQQMKYYFVDDNNRLFLHAGFISQHGPSKEHYQSNLIWDRSLWEMAAAMDKTLKISSPYFPKRLKMFNEIYIGHTPTTNYGIFEPMNIFNLWNVDTGAAFNGKLSLMDVDTKQLWQSDVVRTLYPDETGRVR